MNREKRTSPEYLKQAVIYQLFLRAFTKEGTLKSAEKLLPYLKELGVDIVYLSPVALADDDEDPRFWSPRQIACGLKNPQNPYRIKDYFKIDPEYGTDDDLHDFINSAHALGLKVILDQVYFHCGPTATLITEHPEFVMLDENGKVKNGEWSFPQLNFDNPELREYLIENMLYFVREFQADGHRLDVAVPKMPLDFFEEAHRRLDAFRPGIIMISEGGTPDSQLAGFDAEYGGPGYIIRDIFLGKRTIPVLKEYYQKVNATYPAHASLVNFAENHDIAHDAGDNRLEKQLGADAMDAVFTTLYLTRGIPMLYNGEEVADTCRHSIYANRLHGKLYTIGWENSFTETGKRRFAHLQELSRIRHTVPAFHDDAEQEDRDSGELIVFLRKAAGRRWLVAVNPRNRELTETLRLNTDERIDLRKTLTRRGLKAASADGTVTLAPYGWLAVEL